MKPRSIRLSIFVLLALVQLYVPARMILQQEAILRTGRTYQFKTAPIDPSDPFRGRYIILDYEANTLQVPEGHEWEQNEAVYVLLGTDAEGFAVPESISRTPWEGEGDYLQAHVLYATEEEVVLSYPFDRYYLEETKAPAAEQAYLEAVRDSAVVTYALVRVKDGEGLIEQVMFGDRPLLEVLEDGGE